MTKKRSSLPVVRSSDIVRRDMRALVKYLAQDDPDWHRPEWTKYPNHICSIIRRNLKTPNAELSDDRPGRSLQ